MIELLRTYPQLAVFAAIGIGYWLGQLKFFGFALGSTASVLLAALVIGQLNVPVPDLLKNVSFALFIFTIGYKVGPQFFGSLKKEGIKYVVLSVFFSIVALVTAYLLAKAFAFDAGTAAGILGGALTQSSVLGTADGAIHHLAASAAEQKTMESHVAIAYAITYLFGTAGLILFFKLLPRLVGVDVKAEAAKLAKEMSAEGDAPAELFYWSNRLNLRTYLITDETLVGQSINAVESKHDNAIEIKQIKRDGRIFDAEQDTVLAVNDTVSVIAPAETLAKISLGREIDEKSLRQQTGEILDVCIINKELVGQTLGTLSSTIGRGIFLKRITRQGHELPLTKKTIIHKCDILRIAGAKDDVERAVKKLGYPERPTSTTDLVLVGIGCVLGTLLGIFAIKIGGIPITLGAGGGVLVAGLFAGYLRSLHPTFGQIPTPAQWIFTDLGLNLFIACVGLIAGPKAITALQQMGPSIFVAGVLLSLIPHILSLLFGMYVLRLNFVLLLGALTGAGTITAALNALKDETDSSIPVLGYTVPYAIGNVLLTVWGTVIVYLV